MTRNLLAGVAFGPQQHDFLRLRGQREHAESSVRERDNIVRLGVNYMFAY